MEAALTHGLMLLFAAGMARLGWYMKQNPKSASRWFTLRERPMVGESFAIGWTRIMGWFFTVSACIGIVLYLVIIPFDLFR
jgi:hypothetical protein